MFAQPCNILKINKLYHLNGQNVWYMTYVSIKLLGREGKREREIDCPTVFQKMRIRCRIDF